MSVDELVARINAAMSGEKPIEVSNVVIESPNLKTVRTSANSSLPTVQIEFKIRKKLQKEERLDQEIGSPPGFNYVRERDEVSSQIAFHCLLEFSQLFLYVR